jgi:monoamine oxidase
MRMTSEENDVVVVGAGMAGLTAARALAEASVRVLVLEAQERVGGRVLTQHVEGEAIELGAEFIHGRPPELWALIDEAGLETYERGGSHVCFEDDELASCAGGMDDVFEPLEKLEHFDGPDITFAEYLDREKIPEEERGRLIGYVEGFNAADYRVISAASLGAQQKAEDASDGDRIYRLRGGYDQLPAYLERRIAEYGGRVLTGEPVKEIRWKAGRIEVATDATTFHAKKAVVTLPVAVLQGGSVAISPEPALVLNAASRLRMGQVCRFTLIFREQFWKTLPPHPELSEMSFLYSFSEMPPVWWTPHPEASNSITGWVGGPRSKALARMGTEELGLHACAALARIFGLEQNHVHALLLGCYTHDWQHDAFSGGAYSYVAAGGLDASRQMTEPVAKTLYFAGEHTDITGHWGTVHAAMRSGLRAAAQILDDMN